MGVAMFMALFPVGVTPLGVKPLGVIPPGVNPPGVWLGVWPGVLCPGVVMPLGVIPAMRRKKHLTEVESYLHFSCRSIFLFLTLILRSFHFFLFGGGGGGEGERERGSIPVFILLALMKLGHMYLLTVILSSLLLSSKTFKTTKSLRQIVL